MEMNLPSNHWIGFLSQAVFSAKGNRVTDVNPAAARLQIQPGMALDTLVEFHEDTFQALKQGCVYITVSAGSRQFSATAVEEGEEILFLLDNPQEEDAALRALALAAQQLRQPLSDLMLCTELALSGDGPVAQEAAARLNRGLYQTLRMVDNMSDAYETGMSPRMEYRDAAALFREIFEKLETLVTSMGGSLLYQGPSTPVFCDADRDLLERAVYNLVSNALKFAPQGAQISAKLTKHGSLLTLQIRDRGSGPVSGQKTSLFTRFTREPFLEDLRYGLGLGMVMVRKAAMAHGGSVLVDSAPGGGTRVTFTMKIQGRGILRSPSLKIDYAGELDHSLVELSDLLPTDHYKK